MLDDGRLTDNKGRTVNFKNTVIIMTSNVGSHIIQESFSKLNEKNKDEIVESTKIDVINLLKQTVRPEFINRIDEIIMFLPLSKKDIREIVSLQVNQIADMLKDRDIHIELTEYALDYIADKGFDPVYGARPVKRMLQRELLNELSKQILKGTIKPESTVIVDYFGDGLVFRNNEEKKEQKED